MRLTMEKSVWVDGAYPVTGQKNQNCNTSKLNNPKAGSSSLPFLKKKLFCFVFFLARASSCV